MTANALRISVLIERHHPRTPRYVVVPSAAVAAWAIAETTVVEGKINGCSLGRRSLKRWGEDRWFLDLPERLCRRANFDVGDRVSLEIQIVATALPVELANLLSKSPAARRRWGKLSSSRQRMIREHILSARMPETRERRARGALGEAECE